MRETPLLANTIGRKKLYEMNKVISDTVEHGRYLISNAKIRRHDVEKVGGILRGYMGSMKKIAVGG